MRRTAVGRGDGDVLAGAVQLVRARPEHAVARHLRGHPADGGRDLRRQGMMRAPVPTSVHLVRRAALRLWQWHWVPSTVRPRVSGVLTGVLTGVRQAGEELSALAT
ncbi:hypothetical protein QIT00_30630 [Streptomyces sp. B-S-A12]|uniref:Uncharacterized protein n=1 Tax=Streptomyces luteolus TaxID=3043615 RepID=A0ABT6T7K5_9ACTN|nr:hypothetical protein [Streptomyces sp. B-S-A12]MDI3422847.1 hypothetical protein [Streptomyces sp. B-S-A12]